MARRRRHRDEEEPGEEEIMIVPLVDIVFLLLIFFLVTASLKKPIREWDIKLPDDLYAEKGKINAEEMVIAFFAVEDPKSKRPQFFNHITLTNPNIVREKVSQTEMRDIFKKAQEKKPLPAVRLEIDRNVPFYEVSKVIDTLHSYGLKDILFRAKDR